MRSWTSFYDDFVVATEYGMLHWQTMEGARLDDRRGRKHLSWPGRAERRVRHKWYPVPDLNLRTLFASWSAEVTTRDNGLSRV